MLFNRKLTAQEALARNLVTEIIPHADFAAITQERLQSISKLPREVKFTCKRILYDKIRN